MTSKRHYLEAKELKKEQQVLSKHRRTLLDALHVCQKQIDCLDYLVYTIKKTENKQHKI